jgi:hypothetical protein
MQYGHNNLYQSGNGTAPIAETRSYDSESHKRLIELLKGSSSQVIVHVPSTSELESKATQ